MRFDEQFSRDKFIDWVNDFLPNFTQNVKNVDIPKGSTGIKKIETLGESDLGIRVFIVETNNDPTRRRVGWATDSFNIIKTSGTPNALMAYYRKDSLQWRLSLLTSTPLWSDNRIITKLSNPKRQSYVVGPKAKTKTPYQYLISKGKILNLDDLKNRFSLEVVNKEFYKEVSKAFIKLVGGTLTLGKSKNIFKALLKLPSTKDQSKISLEFAVRLIGRVIFCWFLREKISPAGNSLMPHDLVSLESINNTQDYYHRILEPIFFEVLNKPHKTRVEPFDDELFSQIPYLNGGLFSPQEEDYYKRYKTDSQSQFHNTLIVPDEWFKSFFEVLETYNFTIDENTSFDEELSIDPEMLGRIFENLLAEINPETGESARKSTGSYYTPRVIVDYMVDESLSLYLKEKTGIDENKIKSLITYDLEDDLPFTDKEKNKIIESLGKIKILDPACGSGAFPIGALQKIVFILQQIDPEAKKMYEVEIKQVPTDLKRFIQKEYEKGSFDYLRKLRIIRDCIYGVDIQPIATEISRLRCFLTLIVDQKIDDTLDNRGIQPLPNLDFKFVTANSLVGLPKIDKTQTTLFDDYQKIDELKNVRNDYFNSNGIEREQLKTEFVMQQKRLVDQLIKEHGFMGVAKAELTQQLTDWEPFTHKPTSWFDPEWMFGIKDGFDMVITNPPYITIRKQNDEIKKYIRENYKYSCGADLYVAFLEKSFSLINTNGVIVFICPNKFFGADYGKKIRNELKNGEIKINLIWDLVNEKVFEALISTVVIMFDKHQNQKVTVKNKNGISKMDVFDNRSKIQIEQNNEDKIIINKLNKFKLLINFSKIRTGIMGFEYWKMKPIIHELGEGVPLLTNGNIDQFIDRWGEKEINLYKDKFLNPKIELNTKYINKNTIELFKDSNKIVVRGVAKKLTACLDNKGSGLLVAVHAIEPFDCREIYYLLGLINSNLLNWFHLHTFYSVRIPQGSLKYPVDCISTLPIPDPKTHKDEFVKITNIVKKCIENRGEAGSFVKKIDEIVYKLYGLSKDEIKIVEGKSNE